MKMDKKNITISPCSQGVINNSMGNVTLSSITTLSIDQQYNPSCNIYKKQINKNYI